jgi:hypothetical protein
MKKEIIVTLLILASTTFIVYVVFFHKKKTESNWKPEIRDISKDMRTMQGKGNYENIVGMGGQGF